MAPEAMHKWFLKIELSIVIPWNLVTDVVVLVAANTPPPRVAKFDSKLELVIFN